MLMAARITTLKGNPGVATPNGTQWSPGEDGSQAWIAAAECLAHNIPFALCHLPGENRLDFFCGAEQHSPDAPRQDYGEHKSFIIGRWLAPWSERISIGDFTRNGDPAGATNPSRQFPPDLILPKASFHPDRVISKDEYVDAVNDIIRECRRRNGKTVYSRVIPGHNQLIDIPAAACELFNTFPDSFRFLYYTPMTGCWLGASPESLLDFDMDTRRVSTMAFAGTRPASAEDAPWDDKNLRENLFVADYIRDIFRGFGIEPEISEPYTVRYGAIQHLRRDISAILPAGMDFPELLDKLNPTPALCGTPLRDAIADIRKHELHDRDCYGGFVGIYRDLRPDPEISGTSVKSDAGYPFRGFKSFVNLRSARISTGPDGRFEVIAGGGIIAASDPLSEWEETEAKASRLYSILSAIRK